MTISLFTIRLENQFVLKKKNIPLDTRYQLPKDISIVWHEGKILLIAPECANYIVLEGDKQLAFYRSLTSNTLGDALAKTHILEEKAREVLVQIEAKRFVDEHVPKVNGLFQLHLFLTNACNLRCQHCYMFSGNQLDNELSLDEIIRILRCFHEHDGVFVTFSGGEICTRPDMMEILETAYELKLKVEVMTNGTLWSEEMIKQASQWISSVQISIDGFNEEENAKVRGNGCFEKSLNAVDAFLRLGVRTTIAVTPWYDNNLFEKKREYLQFKHSLMEKYHGMPLEMKFTADLMNGRNITIGEAQKEKYAFFMHDVGNDGNEHAEEDIFVYNQANKIIKDNWCTFGHLTISAQGDVYFCGKVNMVKPICNVRHADLTSIMQLSAKARKMSEIQNLRPCKDCELRYICGGDCRIKYFDWFVDCKNVRDATPDDILPRQCSIETKKHYYDLMIKCNEKLYK